MWSSHERRSGTQLGHDKRDIPAFDCLISLKFEQLTTKITDKIVLSHGPKIIIKTTFMNTLLVA